MENPKYSSGANWSEEEDDALWVAFKALCQQFPTRSRAAVMARLSRSWPSWWVAMRDAE